jgi:putative membrane protein
MIRNRLSQMKGMIRYGYQFQNKEKIILRDYMAMERTRLANERTLMAYVRTSLFFLTGGLTLLELDTFEHLTGLAYIAIILSVSMIIIGVTRFMLLGKRLRTYYGQIKNEEEENKEVKS